MAVISVRYNDISKAKAEAIAESIGISLSGAINIFLNRFIADRGFPFDVTAPQGDAALFKDKDVNAMFLQAIRESTDTPVVPKSAYLDEGGNLRYTDE